MKTLKTVTIFLVLLVVSNVYATDNWRLRYGKTINSDPPFCKFHYDSINYLDYTFFNASQKAGITAAFNTWENLGYIDFVEIFTSGYDILFVGDNFFGDQPTSEAHTMNIYTNEIVAVGIAIDTVDVKGHDVVWTNYQYMPDTLGTTWYFDVQSMITRSIGIALGIYHHSTAAGSETMVSWDDVEDLFWDNTDMRTLESDDEAAHDFLYKKAFCPSEYSEIADPFDLAFPGLTVKVDAGNYSEGSFTVPSGMTLDINEDVNITFSNGSTLTVDGTITADGATFKGTATPGGNQDWQCVRLNNTGTFQNCTFKNATGGIRIESSNSVSVTGCEFDNCYYGVYMNHGGPITVSNNTMTNCIYGVYNWWGGTVTITNNNMSDITSSGIVSLRSSTSISHNKIADANWGMQLIGPTAPSTTSYDTVNSPVISGIKYVYSANTRITNSRIWGGSTACIQTVSSGSAYPNNYFVRQGTNPHIYITDEYTFYAYNNDWGHDNEPVVGGSGTVVWEDEELKISGSGIIAADVDNLISDGVILLNNNKFGDAKTVFKNIVLDFSDHKSATLALSYLNQVLEWDTKLWDTNYSFLTKLKDRLIKNGGNPYIIKTIDLYELDWLQRTGKYEHTLRKYDELLAKTSDIEDRSALMFHKALMYIHDLKQPEIGVPMMQNVAAINSGISELAREELTNLSALSGFYKINKEYFKPINDYKLYGNYPNPFNPVTTIKYDMKKAGHVRINVYNIMGQLVTTLIDREVPVGYHSVQWDGRSGSGRQVSAGMYICRMTAGNTVLSKKMILLK